MSLIDEIVLGLDRALKTLTSPPNAERANPADVVTDATMSSEESRHAAGLMRVNHTGEICAQGLYEGQALTARDPDTRVSLLQAAQEETDHLAWCEER